MARGAIMVNSDAAASWGGLPPARAVSAAPQPAPVSAPSAVVGTGIFLTDAERTAAGLGAKSEWQRAGDVHLLRGRAKRDGKYVRGRTIHNIAAGVEGLGYLVWLRGRMEKDARNQISVPRLLATLRTYLDEPRVVAAVETLQGRGKR